MEWPKKSSINLPKETSYTPYMKAIKPSINVKYSVECNFNGVWEYLRSFTSLDEAEEYFQLQKESAPNCKFRLVREEWQVIG